MCQRDSSKWLQIQMHTETLTAKWERVEVNKLDCVLYPPSGDVNFSQVGTGAQCSKLLCSVFFFKEDRKKKIKKIEIHSFDF